MSKYRKRPLEIEAINYNGDNSQELCNFAGRFWMDWNADLKLERGIHTPEGFMRVNPGDWIIKGIKGEFYVCRPDIFELTYEPSEELGIAYDKAGNLL